ncbi:ABC transporter permease, partial [Klebsiella pneumoniae]|nr:ABC transporter permease [Klebsiella pneumoniae]
MTIYNAFIEEMGAMFSGKTVPYHKASLMIATLTCAIFSMVFSHGTVFEGKIAVIDLDNSVYSTNLIERINTSSYIDVKEVIHTPINVNALTANDRNIGILYLPHGLEENIKSGKSQTSIGYFADYSNDAQNAETISALNEILATDNASISAPKIASLGLGVEQTEALVTPLRLQTRELYNPTHSATNTTVISFVNFFCSIFLTVTQLMLVGRLRVSGRWEHVLKGTPLTLVARSIPYVLFYVTSIALMMSVLAVFGQLRFSGNFYAYLPSMFMTGFAFGMLAIIISWTAKNPGQGASRMIFLVPPGFITGGATMAVGMLPLWGYYASYAFPLVWQYRFFRDFALRGEMITNMLFFYGLYFCYLLVLFGVIT